MRVRRLSVALLPLLAACADSATTGGRGWMGALVVVPEYPALGPNQLGALVIDGVRVRVSRGQTVILDSVVAFPATSNELTISLRVPLEGRVERLGVSLELLGGSTLLFAGAAPVDVAAEGSAPPAHPTIPLVYVGPGANVASLVISPRDMLVAPGSSLALDVAAFDANDAPVPDFYVSWSVSDPRATIDPSGNVALPDDRTQVTVRARTPSGASDAITLTVSPPAASLEILSGDGQTGPVGALLPEELAVVVKAGDGLGVPGAAVRFEATAGSPTPADVTVAADQTGVAHLAVRLGTVAGPATYRASVQGLSAPVTFNLTGSAGVVAVLMPTGGAGQAGTAGQSLASQLAVQARDQFGNPVPGAPISWTVVLGDGDVSVPSGATDATGIARTSLALGALPVLHLVEARATGTPAGYRFAARSSVGPPAAVRELSGSGFTCCVIPVTVAGQVTDGQGNPVSGAPVAWQVMTGFVTFQGSPPTVSGLGGLAAVVVVPDPAFPTSIVRLSVVGAPGVFRDFVIDQNGTLLVQVTIVSGNLQTGTAGAALPIPVTAQATTVDVVGIAGLSLSWQLTTGSGAFSPNPAVTGSLGDAVSTYTAGPVAGVQVARVFDPASRSGDFVRWTIGPAAGTRIEIVDGDWQAAPVGVRTGIDLVAIVVDGFGNPIAGATIAWTASSGTFSTAGTSTDAEGLARAAFVPGVAGPVQVTATVAGGPSAVFHVVGQ